MMVTVGEWLAKAKRRVDTLDAELIVMRAFAPEGADRSWLAVHDDAVLAEEAVKKADELLGRRAQGEPLAYIFGFREFYGREFRVAPGVLIPRPETETLIELIKGLDLPAKPQFLEIGTGSGCIAITLALEFPQGLVVATDVSEEALVIAKANDSAYEGRVEFYQGDLLEDFPKDVEGFDVLVANLPYVDEGWEWLERRALGYEPAEALYAEDGGLALYKKLILQMCERGAGFVKCVIFEADPCQHEEMIEFAEAHGLRFLRLEGFGVVFGVL